MLHKTHILIVDDRQENLLSTRALLESPELNIVCAPSGNAALGLTLDYDFALILLDVQMPDMDGFETAELLRARQKTRHIPIIFLTAISKDSHHVFKGYEKGAVDYLFKPIRPEILQSKVRIFTRLHQQRKELERTRDDLQETVADLRESRQKLRESEEKYRLLVENANDVILIIQEGYIRFHNPRAEEVSGYTGEELRARPFTDYIHPDDREVVLERQRMRMAGISSGIYSFRCCSKSGEDIWTETDAVQIQWEGKAAILAILRDITLQRRLEGKLQQTRKMEAIGTLAGGIAHDFNNILGVIIGYTEMSLRGLGDTEQVKRNMDQILHASERARELVQQILTFSHKNEQEFMPVVLNPLIRETMKLLRASLPKTVEIRQIIPPEPLSILSSPSQIHQILMNLCTNAFHAMEEKGGVLEVSLAPCRVDAETQWQERSLLPGNYIRLTVRDSGCGIDKGILPRVFDPFFTTKEVGKGTGMGLSVVHGIVKNHKGSLHVDSEAGKGTVFEIFFPQILCPVRGEKKTEYRLPPGSGNVLFVDDEELLTEIAKQMLERLGYTPECYNDPVMALDSFRKQPSRFDMLISDMTMPRMSGETLAREVLKIRPEMPVILCTGYSDSMNEEKARHMGVRSLLFKPLDITRLARGIHQVMQDAANERIASSTVSSA